MWDAKLSNVLARLRPGYEWELDHMKECLDKGNDPEEELSMGVGAKIHDVDVSALGEDLSFING